MNLDTLPRGTRAVAKLIERKCGPKWGGATFLIHQKIRSLPRGHEERRKFGRELMQKRH